MPGKQATLSSAMAFLEKNPGFSWRSVYRPRWKSVKGD